MSDLPFGLSADPFALPAALTAEQTARLIENRVRACGGDAVALFPPETCAEIHRHAHGITGAVCDLAGRAMRHAAAAGVPSVSPEHVRAAAGPAADRGDQPDVVETAPARVDTAPAAPESNLGAPNVAAPDDALPDDIPDLPAASEGGFELPSEPSKDLAPDAQAWVSRFISTEGSSAPTGAASPIAHPPAFHDVTVEGAAAAPRIPVERRRAPESSLPPGSKQPERRVARNLPRAAPRGRSRGRRGKAITWVAAAAALVCVGMVVVHRMLAVSAPPPGAQATRLIAARAPAIAPATLPPESTRAALPGQPGARTPALASSRSRAAVSTRPAATSTVTSAQPPAAAPVRESAVSAPSGRGAPKLAIEVAAFIFPDRAETERQRLAAAGHRVRVVTEWENGAPSYRVVLGSYSRRAAAERAVDALLRSGLVQQARIIALAGDE